MRAGIADHLVERRTGQRTDRIEGHVAPELDPQLVADARPHRRLEAGLDEQLRKLRRAFAAAAVRLAQREAVAVGVVDDARFDDVGRRIDDAAQHLRRRQARGQRALGIDRLDDPAVEVPAELVGVPPRHAVDRRDDGRVRPDQGLELRHRRQQRMRLQGQHQIVLRADLLRIGGDAGLRHRLLAVAEQHEAPGAKRVTMRAARHDGDGRTGHFELGGHQAADRTGAENADRGHGIVLRPWLRRGRAWRRGRCAAACPSRPWESRSRTRPCAAP